jgi:NAD(P)H-flavin reductase
MVPPVSRATIARSWDATASARGVVLAVDPTVTDAYTRPGQYVEIGGGEDPAIYAMARGPSRSRGELELLVKKRARIAGLEAGAEVQISMPVGAGFPVAEVQGRPAILVGVGTGIAPLRALLHELDAPSTLYYGHRDEPEFAYGDELDKMTEVIRVASAPGPDWRGLVGRVQDALRDRPPPRLAGAVAFVCGPEEMVVEVKGWFVDRGVDAFVNY